MEEKALKTMGENKASYILKGNTNTSAIFSKFTDSRATDQISKVPASDQEDVKELKSGLSNLGGGALQNPLGKFAGDSADDATKDFTGR